MTAAPRTLVEAGGTDGIGRALAEHHLAHGDAETVIGRDPRKAAGFRAAAEALGAGGRTRFVGADLSSVARTREVVDELAATSARIDALVLGGGLHHRSSRRRQRLIVSIANVAVRRRTARGECPAYSRSGPPPAIAWPVT